MKYHTCKITGCNKKNAYKTICGKHYYQLKKFGKPVVTRYDKRNPIILEDCVKIPLGVNAKDGYTLIDLEDKEQANYKWHKSTSGYAIRKIDNGFLRLHREVFGAEKGQYVDHINMDKLDNRKSNLRLATSAQNKANKSKQSNNTSGYKGVYRRNNRWLAKVVKQGKQHYAGIYKTREEAAKAYNAKAVEIFGDFARLNNLTRKRG